jgi:membrane-associated protease RseP (regulator of RpoE activity)
MNKATKTLLIQIGLFILTIGTTTLAGAEWMHGRVFFYGSNPMGLSQFLKGFEFSIPFLIILTAHEFGHFFTARFHKVKVTLPFYIPLWLGFIPGMPSIGTMGAFIRLKSFVYSKKQHFDIGIAGPIAGFIVALAVLFYGFTHLPPAEHIYSIHPEYEAFGLDYAHHVYQGDSIINITLGKNLTYLFFEQYVAPDPSRVPNPHEIIHYPWLFAGFLALFFTALNLLPVGQLDGGHVIYGLFGPVWHKRIATVFLVGFVSYAGLGIVHPADATEDLLLAVPLYLGFLYLTLSGLKWSKRNTLMTAAFILTGQFLFSTLLPDVSGYQGWLLFLFIVGRFLGVEHPRSAIEEPLDWRRKVLGWMALMIFIISFSPAPLMIG